MTSNLPSEVWAVWAMPTSGENTRNAVNIVTNRNYCWQIRVTNIKIVYAYKLYKVRNRNVVRITSTDKRVCYLECVKVCEWKLGSVLCYTPQEHHQSLPKMSLSLISDGLAIVSNTGDHFRLWLIWPIRVHFKCSYFIFAVKLLLEIYFENWTSYCYYDFIHHFGFWSSQKR